jgi:hypothetical protein
MLSLGVIEVHNMRSSLAAVIALFLLGPAAPIPVAAAPTSGIDKLLSTPASAFDVFLYRLYIAANAATFFGGSNMSEPIRIFDLNYDYDSNLITMKFHISVDHKLMNGFTGRTLDAKKEILVRAAQNLAESLGVAPRDGKIRIGLLQMTEIRYGWVTKDLDESKIKDEIADRTVIELIYAGEEKTLYSVRRTHTGRYEFAADAK